MDEYDDEYLYCALCPYCDSECCDCPIEGPEDDDADV